MIIQCPNCAARFKFDETKLAPKGAKFRCKSCQHVFMVMPPTGTERVAAPSLTPPRPAVSAPLPPQAPTVTRPIPAPPRATFSGSAFPPPDEHHRPPTGALAQTQLASSFAARPAPPVSNRQAAFPPPQNTTRSVPAPNVAEPTGGFATMRGAVKGGNSISSQWDAGDFLAAQTGKLPGTQANMPAAKITPPMGHGNDLMGMPPMEDNPAETRSIDLEQLAREEEAMPPGLLGNSESMLDLSAEGDLGDSLELDTGPRPIPTKVEFQGLDEAAPAGPAVPVAVPTPSGAAAKAPVPIKPKEPANKAKREAVALDARPGADNSMMDQMTNDLEDNSAPASTASLGDSLELDAPASKKGGMVALAQGAKGGVALDGEGKANAKGFRPPPLKGRKTTKVMKTEEIPQMFTRAVKVAFAVAALWVTLIGATMVRQGDEFDINVLTLGGMVKAWVAPFGLEEDED